MVAQTKTNIVLEGAALCTPLMQGHLDSLCGLYATLNALSIVCAPVAPLTTKQQNHLFRTGLAWLERRASLADVVSHGMAYDLHIGLTKALCNEVRARSGVDIAIYLPDMTTASFTQKRIHHFIDQALAEGVAVVVCLDHTLDHYSVIVGDRAGRYQLHDSIGMKWLQRDNLGPLRGGSTVRHQVKRKGLVKMKLLSSRPQRST